MSAIAKVLLTLSILWFSAPLWAQPAPNNHGQSSIPGTQEVTGAPKSVNVCRGQFQWPTLPPVPEVKSEFDLLFLPKALFTVGEKFINLSGWTFMNEQQRFKIVRDQIVDKAKSDARIRSSLSDAEIASIADRISKKVSQDRNAPDKFELKKAATYEFVWWMILKQLNQSGVPCASTEDIYPLATHVLQQFWDCQARADDDREYNNCLGVLDHTVAYQMGHLIVQLLIPHALYMQQGEKANREQIERNTEKALKSYDRCARELVLRDGETERELNTQVCVGESVLRTVWAVSMQTISEELKPYVNDEKERRRLGKVVFGNLGAGCAWSSELQEVYNVEGRRQHLRSSLGASGGSDLFRRQLDICTSEISIQGAKVAGDTIALTILQDRLSAKPELRDQMKEEFRKQVEQCLIAARRVAVTNKSLDMGVVGKNCVTREAMVLALDLGSKLDENNVAPPAKLNYAPGSTYESLSNLVDNTQKAFRYGNDGDSHKKLDELKAELRAIEIADSPTAQATLQAKVIRSSFGNDLIEGGIAAKLRTELNASLLPHKDLKNDKNKQLEVTIHRISGPVFLRSMLEKNPDGQKLMSDLKEKLLGDPKYDPAKDQDFQKQFRALLLKDSGPGSFTDLVLQGLAAPAFDAYWASKSRVTTVLMMWVAAKPESASYWHVMRSPGGNDARIYFKSHILEPLMNGQKFTPKQMEQEEETLRTMIEEAASDL